MHDLSEPAALWRRFAAIFYDSLLVTALLFVLTAAVVIARGGATFDPTSAAFRALLVLATWLYFAWCWTHGGQTVGMRAWKLRLETADGGTLSWAQTLLHFFGAWLAALPLGLGYWWSLFDPERRCWHERLAHTRIRRLPGNLRSSAHAGAPRK